MNDTMNLWVIHTICEYLFLLETCFVSLQPSTQPLNIITREKKLALTHFPIKISFQFNFNCIILTSKCDKISPLRHQNNIYGFCLCADYHYYLWKFDSNWSLVTKSNYPLVFWFSICFFFARHLKNMVKDPFDELETAIRVCDITVYLLIPNSAECLKIACIKHVYFHIYGESEKKCAGSVIRCIKSFLAAFYRWH